MTVTFLTLSLGIFFTAFLLYVLPARPRRGLYFGVTVADEFPQSDGGKRLARRYRAHVWLGSLVALLTLAFAVWSATSSLFPIALLTPVPFALAGWVVSWKEVKRHAIAISARRSAPVETERMPVGLAGGLFAAACIVLACCAAVLLGSYDALPDKFPVHYGISGKADRFVEKTILAVIAPLLIGGMVIAILAWNAFGIAYGSRRGGPPELREFRRAHRAFAVRTLAGFSALLAMLLALVAIAPLEGPSLPAGPWGLLVCVAALIGFAVWSLLHWHKLPSGGGDGTPDAAWKWGLLYWNPEDPAWMVERRDNVGFAPNFAHPFAWILVALVALLVAAPRVLIG